MPSGSGMWVAGVQVLGPVCSFPRCISKKLESATRARVACTGIPYVLATPLNRPASSLWPGKAFENGPRFWDPAPMENPEEAPDLVQVHPLGSHLEWIGKQFSPLNLTFQQK